MKLRVLAYCNFYVNLVENCLAKTETHEITREVLKEFISETFAGKTSKAYHDEIVQEIKSRNNFISSIKGI